MKKLIRTLFLITALCLALLIVAFYDDQEVAIQSQESKTESGNAVFNKIKWFRFKDKDVWMMNQSHHGRNAEAANWSRLAIVVDKTSTPKKAQFYQFEPGSLQWNENLKPIAISVACFICHANGPRTIRPNNNSVFSSTSAWDRLKISTWNLRMKTYGRVVLDEKQAKAAGPMAVQFLGPYASQELKLATCTKCHQDQGFLARGSLQRQHIPTIKFMLENGYMPPLGHRLTDDEKDKLETFLRGYSI